MQPGEGKYVWRNDRTCSWLSLASCKSCRIGAWAKGHLRLNPNAIAPIVTQTTIKITMTIFPERLCLPWCRVWLVLGGIAVAGGMMILEAGAAIGVAEKPPCAVQKRPNCDLLWLAAGSGNKKATRAGGLGKTKHLCSRLLENDHPEIAIRVAGTGGKEKLILLAVRGRPTAELDSPETADAERFAGRIGERPHQLSGGEVVGIDRTCGGVVRDQQRLAECSKVRWSYGKTPRLVQRFAVGKVFHERSGFAENINITTCGSGSARERNIDLPTNVLDSERREPRRKCRIGE